jgi:periplasmic copper chaperone A
MARLLLSSALLAAVLPMAVLAQSAIKVERAWSRAAPQGGVGALFMTVTDDGGADQLVGVSTPLADRVELHESSNDNGVMKMRRVEKLPVSSGKPLILAPGGYHVMLMGLKQPLREGDSFPVTLAFEKAGTVPTEVTVARAGSIAPAGHEPPRR